MKKKNKILGICLGFQLLGKKGYEDGESQGLGLIDSEVIKFSNNKLKVPHVGFNNISIINKKSLLYKDIDNLSDFYFVHSYLMPYPNKNIKEDYIATCTYGEKFIASVELNNIFGTQFHPEKSQSNGLKLIKNFLN